MIQKFRQRNLSFLYQQASPEIQHDGKVKELLRSYDLHANVYWKLSHLAAASKHLVHEQKATEATGGTNWKQFLPPKYQRIIFFPELWSEEEIENWGKAAVLKHFQESVVKDWLK